MNFKKRRFHFLGVPLFIPHFARSVRWRRVGIPWVPCPHNPTVRERAFANIGFPAVCGGGEAWDYTQDFPINFLGSASSPHPLGVA